MLILVENILRWLFSWIDRVIVVIMNAIYGLLMDLATLNIVNMETVKNFSSRIGLVLGIFMLFNLAINLLNYIVSPDKFSDNKQGGGKIMANIFISLVLLATVNIIFESAYKLQYAVLKKQIIPQIVFGTAAQDPTTDVEISYYILTSMMTINSEIDTEGVCKNVYLEGKVSDECYDLLNPLLDDGYYQFERAVEQKDASKLLTADNITATGKSGNEYEFVFNYLFLFSTVVGVITTFILFNFCLDIAKRSVKLYFYQIIAPIPIIANMIPGKGSETFKKWYKSCISTYIDIFIRLAVLFFAIFIISTVYSTLGDTLEGKHKILGVFIILGALMFAKELPQLLQDLTGIKLDGTFTVNPIKKLNQVPVVGKGFGAIGGAIAGGRAGGRVGNTLGGALTGAFMGASSIPLGGSKDGKLALSSATNDVYKRMTGTEFINFSLAKAPLRMGAKARIDEIKAARNLATEQLNAYNTDLNTSQKLTTDLAARLNAQGIDISNLGNERARLAQLKKNGNSISTDDYNSAIRDMSGLEEQKNRLNELLHYANQAGDKEQVKELTEKIKETTSKINTAAALKKQFEQNEEILRGIDGTLDLINKYSNGIDEQNELRKRISTVQKDIDDLNNEKRQRERFYDYDPSPQEDIRTLVSDTHSRVDKDTGNVITGTENYKARIDERIKPKE